ncbi:MAG TPA: efflux RND transporter permease subunit, partial [Steroidobacteraceae bacterium]|nr:efflux RND transporter permease subunit [Steroidobacteraceae bacterium]
ARVGIGGGRRYAMRVWVDRQGLAARKLTVGDIESALRRENVELPAGRLQSGTREFSLRTLVGLETEADFRNLVISRGDDGHLVRLGEVANVQLAAESERTLTRFNGRIGIGMSIEAQSTGNTLSIVRGVRAELDRMRETLPKGTYMGIGQDNGIAIEAALHEVVIAIGFALLSVLAVIYAFLGNLRATLIPAVTIPVSIIAAFTVMYALGYSVNVLTLLGLVLAIGLVVDDAIVVLENIHRRTELGEKPFAAAVRGSHEIGFAVVATTATLAAVFVPISFLPGDLGRLFREFGFTLAASVVFSAVIALTLTPMMASRLPADASHSNRVARAIERFFERLAAFYNARLRVVVRRPWYVLGAVGVMAVLTAFTFRTIPTEFAPSADSGRLFLNIEGPEGSSFDYMDNYARRVEEIIIKQMEEGDIMRLMMRVPGGGGGGSAGDVNSARGNLVLVDWHERDRSARQVADAIMAETRKLPGVRVNIAMPSSLGRRGSNRPVEAVIGGPDYESLSKWTGQLIASARENPGLESVDTNYKERKPQLRVSIDRDRAADMGVSLQTVGRTLETVLGSRVVTRYIDRGQEYNVILQARDDARQTVDDLTNIQVRSDRTGQLIPLSSVVKIDEASGAMRLSRFNRMRAVKIQAGLKDGYTMGEATKWFEETVAKDLPTGSVLMWDGESGEYKRSGGQLYLTFVFALVIVFLVLAAQFESFVHPMIIMATVPLALIGAVFGLKLYGMSINIFSQIAVIMLIGIAAKNGVLIVEFANQLRAKGVERVEAVVQAAVTRLRPVLMTSMSTAFGALPFLFATGSGAEQRRPIGIVVFYGTLVSVFLTLLVVPAVYSLFARRTKSPEHVSRLVDESLNEKPVGDANAVQVPHD